MLALLPLRALATVTVGFCAMHHASAGVHADHGHDHDGAPHGDDTNHEPCNACVEHCSSASLLSRVGLSLPAAAGANRIAAGDRFTAGFVPDQLDPPPLAR